MKRVGSDVFQEGEIVSVKPEVVFFMGSLNYIYSAKQCTYGTKEPKFFEKISLLPLR